MKIALILLVALALVLGGLLLIGSQRWQAGTDALHARLVPQAVVPPRVTFRELNGLPAPVQRYFRAVLKDGQPMVAGARIQHAGTFNMGESQDQWKPFTSDQRVVTHPRGFDWDARIAMLPGVPVRVHDAYVQGEGILQAAVAGLFTVAELRGATAVAEGELMRFVAEAVWYPTALLPSQGVRWTAVDDHSAIASVTDGGISLDVRFGFDDAGLIDTVAVGARGRTVGDKVIPTPWQGRFWDYTERSGMQVPLQGEVAWVLPGGARPYWRGQMTGIRHELAE